MLVGQIKTREIVWTLPHTAAVSSVVFHPSKPIVVTGGDEGGLRWWRLTDGALIREVDGHGAPVEALQMIQNGKLLASGGRDSKVRLWDESGVLQGAPLAHGNWVKHIATSPDQRRLLVSSTDKRSYVWDLESRQLMMSPISHARAPGWGGYNPWGRWFLTAGWDGFIRFWNVQNGARMDLPMIRNRYPIRRASISKDGRRILTGCVDGSVRIWDLAGRQIPEFVDTFTVSHGRRQGLLNRKSAGFGLMDFQDLRHPFRPVPTAAGTVVVSCNERGNRVVVATLQPDGGGYLIQLAEAGSGRPFGQGVRASHRPSKVIFDPKDEVAALQWTRQVVVFSAAGNEMWRKETPEEILDLTFSPDSRFVAVGVDTNVVVWTLADGADAGGPWAHAKPVRRVRFNRGSNLLIACSLDRMIDGALAQPWDLRTGRPAGPPLWHMDGVVDAAWLSDDQIVTGSEDGTVRVWNRNSGEIVSEEMMHGFEVATVDVWKGSAILSASLDQTTRLWEGGSGLPLGPMFEYPLGLRSARWIPGTSRVVVMTDKSSWLQTIPVSDLPIRDLVRLGTLLSGELAAGRSPEEFSFGQEREWRSLRQEHAALFSTSEDELVNWYWYEAEMCHRAGADESAAALLDQILKLRPRDLRTEARKENYLGAVKKATKPPASVKAPEKTAN